MILLCTLSVVIGSTSCICLLLDIKWFYLQGAEWLTDSSKTPTREYYDVILLSEGVNNNSRDNNSQLGSTLGASQLGICYQDRSCLQVQADENNSTPNISGGLIRKSKHCICCNAWSYPKACYRCENGIRPVEVFDKKTESCCYGKVIRLNSDHFIRNCKETNNLAVRKNTLERSDQAVATVPKFVKNGRDVVEVCGLVLIVAVLVVLFKELKCVSHLNNLKLLVYIDSLRNIFKKSQSLTLNASHGRKTETKLDIDSTESLQLYNNSRLSHYKAARVDKRNILETEAFLHGRSEGDQPLGNKSLRESPIHCDVKKDIEPPCKNFETNLFQDVCTQTLESGQHEKLTILGIPFAHKTVLNGIKATVADPWSDVTMTLPACLTNLRKILVYWISFDDINALISKLNLTQKLASPVVEYWIVGVEKLKEHAVITMPYIGPPDNLQVWRFHSDDGLSPIPITEKIPCKRKVNADHDTFYIINGDNVLIYTRQFSGFLCTCGHKREDLQFRVHMFGSITKQTAHLLVQISVYIADAIYKFKDYKRRMLKNEVDNQSRKEIKECQLRMPERDLAAEDYIEISLPSTNFGEHWKHRSHPTNHGLIYEETEKFRLKDLAKKCRECDQMESDGSRFPKNKEWLLITRSRAAADFEGVIDMNICDKNGNVLQRNSIPILNLALPTTQLEPAKLDNLSLEEKLPVEESGEAADPMQNFRPDNEQRQAQQSDRSTESNLLYNFRPDNEQRQAQQSDRSTESNLSHNTFVRRELPSREDSYMNQNTPVERPFAEIRSPINSLQCPALSPDLANLSENKQENGINVQTKNSDQPKS